MIRKYNANDHTFNGCMKNTNYQTIQLSNMLKYALLSFKIISLQSLYFKLSKKCKRQEVHKIISSIVVTSQPQ